MFPLSNVVGSCDSYDPLKALGCSKYVGVVYDLDGSGWDRTEEGKVP